MKNSGYIPKWRGGRGEGGGERGLKVKTNQSQSLEKRGMQHL